MIQILPILIEILPKVATVVGAAAAAKKVKDTIKSVSNIILADNTQSYNDIDGQLNKIKNDLRPTIKEEENKLNMKIGSMFNKYYKICDSYLPELKTNIDGVKEDWNKTFSGKLEKIFLKKISKSNPELAKILREQPSEKKEKKLDELLEKYLNEALIEYKDNANGYLVELHESIESQIDILIASNEKQQNNLENYYERLLEDDSKININSLYDTMSSCIEASYCAKYILSQY